MSGPLDGLKVLDLSRLLPGGYATLMLADLGADVVKVEEPGRGDYVRWMPPMAGEFSASHIALNRNKRSITLDLKKPSGVRLFLELAKQSDVLVESFRPGVLRRLGLGYDAVSEANPRLVYCSITGYGQDGPRASEAGHDINYTGYAGVLGLNGEEGAAPVAPGLQIADLAGGGNNAVISILAALLHREVTGRGDHCDVSMTDGAASWLSVHAAQYSATRELPQRGLMPLSGAFPCYRVYGCTDGFLAVGALEPRFWEALMEALDRKDLSDDAFATGTRRDEVITSLEKDFSKRTRSEWMEVLAGLDVCVAPVNNLAEAFEDPQLRHRGMFYEAPVPGAGDWTHVGNPIRLEEAGGARYRQPPPRLGEHTPEVLEGIGVGASQLEELRTDGVV